MAELYPQAIDAMPNAILALELAQLSNRLSDPNGGVNHTIAAELVAEAADRITKGAMPEPSPQDMPGGEAIEMMHRAASEIRQLQRTIARMGPQAEAYRYLAIVLDMTRPDRGEAYGEDIAGRLEKRAAELKSIRGVPKPGKADADL